MRAEGRLLTRKEIKKEVLALTQNPSLLAKTGLL